MDGQIVAFTKELKALIAHYGYGLPEANQALAIISNELEEKKLKDLLEGKK